MAATFTVPRRRTPSTWRRPTKPVPRIAAVSFLFLLGPDRVRLFILSSPLVVPSSPYAISGMNCCDRSENAAEVAAAVLADFVGCKALFQHLAGDRIEKSAVLVRPDFVGVRKNIGCREVRIGTDA